MKKFFVARTLPVEIDVVLLLIRLVCGCAFLFHGWGKIQNPFHWMGPDASIPPLLQALAALSEFGGGLAWMTGLLTRLASLGMACTMAAAVHMHMIVLRDPFVNMSGCGSYEPASVFLLISLLLLTAGPGRFSLDRLLFGVKS